MYTSTTMMQEANASSNETQSTSNSFATDQTNLLWNLSQIATGFNFSVELYIFLSLLLYELHTDRFKGKLSDPLVIGKIITALCPVFAMLNLITMEVMILGDKYLIQHQYGEEACRVIYIVQPLVYAMAVITPYIFLWYRMLSLYKVSIFIEVNTRLVRMLKAGVISMSILWTVAVFVLYFMNIFRNMTAAGCLLSKGKSVWNFIRYSTLVVQVLCSVIFISLMLYPLLSHKETCDEEQEGDGKTKQLVMKATKVSVISLAVSVSVDSLIFVLIWFYPANWISFPIHVLFEYSVLVKNISVLFFFDKSLEILFGWCRKYGVNESNIKLVDVSSSKPFKDQQRCNNRSSLSVSLIEKQ